MIVIKNIEELQIFSKWFQTVLEKHCHCSRYFSKDRFRPVEIHFREKIRDNEVDLIIVCSVGEYDRIYRRTIGFELKTSDLCKAVDQAIRRRDDFTYFYIVLDASVVTILSLLRNDPIRRALDYGIGFISGKDDCVVIHSYTKHNVQYASAFKTIFDYIRSE